MIRRLRRLPLALVTGALLLGGASSPIVRGAQEFEKAQIFFKLNNTDGDLGIHASVDGEELSFESAEPDLRR